jgi:hypothetical protein
VKVDSHEEGGGGEGEEATEMGGSVRSVKQVALWVMAAVYTSYLFLLPYAPVTQFPLRFFPLWIQCTTKLWTAIVASIQFNSIPPLLETEAGASL